MLEISYKNSCVNSDALSRQNGSFIFPKIEVLRSEYVKNIIQNLSSVKINILNKSKSFN